MLRHHQSNGQNRCSEKRANRAPQPRPKCQSQKDDQGAQAEIAVDDVRRYEVTLTPDMKQSRSALPTSKASEHSVSRAEKAFDLALGPGESPFHGLALHVTHGHLGHDALYVDLHRDLPAAPAPRRST